MRYAKMLWARTEVAPDVGLLALARIGRQVGAQVLRAAVDKRIRRLQAAHRCVVQATRIFACKQS